VPQRAPCAEWEHSREVRLMALVSQNVNFADK